MLEMKWSFFSREHLLHWRRPDRRSDLIHPQANRAVPPRLLVQSAGPPILVPQLGAGGFEIGSPLRKHHRFEPREVAMLGIERVGVSPGVPSANNVGLVGVGGEDGKW